MIHPIRRLHAWITGIHAWYYLGSADYMESLDEDEWIAPGYAAREERPSWGERVEENLFNELRKLPQSERHGRGHIAVAPDSTSLTLAGVPADLHDEVFGERPKRITNTMVFNDM